MHVQSSKTKPSPKCVLRFAEFVLFILATLGTASIQSIFIYFQVDSSGVSFSVDSLKTNER